MRDHAARILWLLSLLALLVRAPGIRAQGDVGLTKTPPNFVLILADDCTWSDLEVYGGQAKTPRLNRLAQQGMKFRRCFQAASMCSPTRHALYTGLYPVKSGAWPNHTRAYDGTRSVAHYLQAAGYRTHLSGKFHVGPRSVFPFQRSGKKNPDMPKIDAFLGGCVRDRRPFLLIAASNEPHAPWTRNKAGRAAYPPEKIRLPPIAVDTPQTREQFCQYFAEISYFDSQVGQVLDLLDRHELADNTMVLVLSEQGAGMPFAKWTCYEAGLRSGLIVRWPGRVAPGSTTDAMVEYVDVVPTLLAAAGLAIPGLAIPGRLDGRSFLPVLGGEATTHKAFVFGLQTSRGIHSGPEHYGIRSVRGARYRLIRNLTPEAKFQNTITAGRAGAWASWKAAAAAGDAAARRLVHDYQHRPAEELYDCEADPWNRHNRIGDAELLDEVKALRAALDGWMKSQGDAGQAIEMRALERQGPGRRKPNAAPAGQPNRKKVPRPPPPLSASLRRATRPYGAHWEPGRRAVIAANRNRPPGSANRAKNGPVGKVPRMPWWTA